MKNDEKILSRIRKLLAMSKDTGSPNEAAIAAGRARKLMDQYQITEIDLTVVKDDDLGTNAFSTGKINTVTVVGKLAVSVAKLNDVIVSWANDSETGRMNLLFKGFFVDAVCATEMLKYLRDEMYRQSKINASGRRDHAAFRSGFVSGVAHQVNVIMVERRKLKTSSGTSLIVVKDQLVRAKYGIAHYSKSKGSNHRFSAAFADGERQGREVGLSHQVSGNQQRQLT